MRLDTTRGPVLVSAVVGSAAFAWAYPLAVRRLVLSDEGYLLGPALQLLNGKALYRDLDVFVTPGVWLLLLLTFATFEPSVFLGRLVAVGGFAILCLIATRLAYRLGNRSAAVLCFAGLLTMAVWAFPGWTIPFYSPFSMLISIAALGAHLRWHREPTRSHAFWTGILLNAAILFKQNYAVFATQALAAHAFSSWIRSPASERPGHRGLGSHLTWLTAEATVTVLPIFHWLGQTGAAHDAIHKLLLVPFTEFTGHHSMPFAPARFLLGPAPPADRTLFLTYSPTPLWQVPFPEALTFLRGPVWRLGSALYWIPVHYATLQALTRSRHAARLGGTDLEISAVRLFALGLFLEVFPRADFNHLMHVYQPVVLLLAVEGGRRLPRLWPRLKTTAVAVLGLPVAHGVAPGFW